MVFDEGLAQRVREALAGRTPYVEKRIFGGLAFMVRGHMALGVVKDDLMVRLADEEQQAVLKKKKGARPMDFTGRPMKGSVFVGPDGLADDAALEGWIKLALAHAKSLAPK